jgi:hypothetical protein
MPISGTRTGANACKDDPALMEPMMPPEGERRLEDPAVELVAKASALAGRVYPHVRRSVGALGRRVNCYYSNLIEGHATHPRDIDRALARDYATEPRPPGRGRRLQEPRSATVVFFNVMRMLFGPAT